MKRSTVYIEESVDLELKRLARQTGHSQAELIREGIREVIAKHKRKRPLPKSVGMVNSGNSELADSAEDLLWTED